MFNFQRLDVYQCVLKLLPLMAALSKRAPEGFPTLRDQLRRATQSVLLNTAEGSSRYNKDEKRYFTFARGSALECAAILDAYESLSEATTEELAPARELLVRIVGMLTRLSKD